MLGVSVTTQQPGKGKHPRFASRTHRQHGHEKGAPTVPTGVQAGSPWKAVRLELRVSASDVMLRSEIMQNVPEYLYKDDFLNSEKGQDTLQCHKVRNIRNDKAIDR